jgi:hypothetical protein
MFLFHFHIKHVFMFDVEMEYAAGSRAEAVAVRRRSCLIVAVFIRKLLRNNG